MHKQENLKKRLLASAEQHPKMSLYSKNNTGSYNHTRPRFLAASKGHSPLTPSSEDMYPLKQPFVNGSTVLCQFIHLQNENITSYETARERGERLFGELEDEALTNNWQENDSCF